MNNNRLDSLLKILAENQTDAFVLFAIAKEYEGKGNVGEALSYYLKLKELQSGLCGTLLSPGSSLHQTRSKRKCT